MLFYQEEMNSNNLKMNSTNNIREGGELWEVTVGEDNPRDPGDLLKRKDPNLVLCMDWKTGAQREAVPGAGTHSKSVWIQTQTPGSHHQPPIMSASFSWVRVSARLTRTHTTSSLLNPPPKCCKPSSSSPPQKKKEEWRIWTYRLM